MANTSKVVTTDGQVLCGHGPGEAKLSAKHKLKVSGASVVLSGDIQGAGVTKATCNITDKTVNGKIVDQHCKTVLSVIKGQASKLKVDNEFVILDDKLQGTTDGYQSGSTPLSALNGSATQTKLKAL